MLTVASEVRQTRCRQVLNDARLQVAAIEAGPVPFACAWADRDVRAAGPWGCSGGKEPRLPAIGKLF